MVDIIEAQSGQPVKVEVNGITKPGQIVKRDMHMWTLLVEYSQGGDLEREWFPADDVTNDKQGVENEKATNS